MSKRQWTNRVAILGGLMNNLTLARAGRFLLDIVYPPPAPSAASSGAFLCDACEASLPRADGDRCQRCWLPLHQAHCEPQPCVRSAALALSVRRRGSQARPSPQVLAPLVPRRASWRQLLQRQSRSMASRQMRSCRCRCGRCASASAATTRRRCWRRKQASTSAIRSSSALQREGTSGAQARALNAAEQRRRNVEGAFSLRPRPATSPACACC